MEYIIKNKTKKTEVVYYDDANGLEINPTNNTRSSVINVNKMILMDPKLISEYIRIRLDKKFNDIFKKLYVLLQDEDATEDGVTTLLDEVERFKQIINVKYSKYLESKKKRELIAKIVLIEEELKQKYVQIKYIENLLNTDNYSFDSNYQRGRGR